jgi:hypothetical protein
MAAPARDGGVLERPALTWGRGAVAVLGVVAVAVLAWRLAVHRAGAGTAHAIPGERVPYAVEVLNATDVDGLARAVTLHLREQGIDVVFYGTADSAVGDTTLIVVRGADTKAGDVVRDVLGVGRVLVDPDPRLLLDVSVFLGRDAAASHHP